MNNNAHKKECPYCQHHFTAKRLNQVYCTVSCKARYNNHLAKLKIERSKEQQEIRKKIDRITFAKNSILWTNRLALKRNIGQEVNIDLLQEEEFKLNFITNFDEFKNERNEKTNIFYIYDYGYYFIDEHTIKIIEA